MVEWRICFLFKKKKKKRTSLFRIDSKVVAEKLVRWLEKIMVCYQDFHHRTLLIHSKIINIH